MTAMSRPLGFGIVGCGMIARFHARALQDVPGTKIVALVSRTPANAQKLLSETNTPPCDIYPDLAAALARPDLDAVIIATPSAAHAEPAVAAATAGKHVVDGRFRVRRAGRRDDHRV